MVNHYKEEIKFTCRNVDIRFQINKFLFNQNKDTAIVGSYDITMDIAGIPILIRNIKIIKGKENLFMKFPSSAFRHKNSGKIIETTYVKPMDANIIKKLNDWLIGNYEEKLRKIIEGTYGK